MLAEKCFGCRPYAKPFGKLFLTAVSDPCNLGSKARNMVLFLLQKAFGDKHGHIDIFVSCFLKASVKVLLNKLPYSIAIWPDNHTTLYA